MIGRHVVTKQSKDGTFELGDHVIFYEDGSIGCIEAHGWIDCEDVPNASLGMETKVDGKF